jgi:hypothetical protein
MLISPDFINGVLYTKANPSFTVVRDGNFSTGYRVVMAIVISHPSMEFIDLLQRTLLQLEIDARVGRRGTYPTLRIMKKKSIEATLDCMEIAYESDCISKKWRKFLLVWEIYSTNRHLTQKGIDEIIEILDS